MEKIDRIGSIDCVTGSDRPRTARTAGNVAAISQWRRHLSVCVRAHGAHFAHCMHTLSIHSDNFEMKGVYTNL